MTQAVPTSSITRSKRTAQATTLPNGLTWCEQPLERKSFFNGVHEMWINSLLSGWFTHLKNTAGVTAAIVLDTTELAVTAARQAPDGLGGRERDVTFGDVQAHLF